MKLVSSGELVKPEALFIRAKRKDYFLTWSVPREQYSVNMQTLFLSGQTPISRVRLGQCTSRIYRLYRQQLRVTIVVQKTNKWQHNLLPLTIGCKQRLYTRMFSVQFVSLLLSLVVYVL